MAAVHIHQDIITGIVMQRPCLDDLLDAIQPGDALVATALGRLASDTLGLLSWSGRGAAGAGVEMAEGNTNWRCLIVSQAWIRTVRSYRSIPSLPTPGGHVNCAAADFPGRLLDPRVFGVRAKIGFSAQAAVHVGCDLCSGASSG